MAKLDLEQRMNKWALRHPFRVRGVPMTVLVLRIVQTFLKVRVMGLAGEMTYYALLSFFPLIGALGASLGFMERIVGTEAIIEIEATVLQSMRTVFSAQMTEEIVGPMVQGLLEQERAGFALTGFLITLFLASRIFRSAIDTLDAAYDVEERRGIVSLWMLGFLFALGAIVTASIVLSMVVLGPLLGNAQVIARLFGLGSFFEILWALARLPLVLIVATAFLATLYRVGPNVRKTWLQSLPGAVVGMILLILVSLGFRMYLGFTGVVSPEIRDADEMVAMAAQAVGILMAALLWLWLSAVAILAGGVVNAELSRIRPLKNL
jgi:membrane protein